MVLNNRDYNIDKNNRDYGFCHNRAALHYINCDFINSGFYLLSDWT